METTSSPTSSERSRPSRPRVALAAWLGLVALQVALNFTLAGRADEADAEPIYDYGLAIGTAVIYGLLIAITLAIASAYPDRRSALGLRGFAQRWVWVAFGVAFLALLVAAGIERLFDLNAGEQQGLLPEELDRDRIAPLVVNGIVIVTLVPFTEELFFRGLGVPVLRVFGAVAAVLGTALAFALSHGILGAVPALLLFAAGLAWVRLRSDSVWPGVIAHGVYNGLVLGLALYCAEHPDACLDAASFV